MGAITKLKTEVTNHLSKGLNHLGSKDLMIVTKKLKQIKKIQKKHKKYRTNHKRKSKLRKIVGDFKDFDPTKVRGNDPIIVAQEILFNQIKREHNKDNFYNVRYIENNQFKFEDFLSFEDFIKWLAVNQSNIKLDKVRHNGIDVDFTKWIKK